MQAPESQTLPPQALAALLDRGLREIVLTLNGVDIEALSRWIASGVGLFSKDDGLPAVRTVIQRARDLVLLLAYERHGGNISHMAKALGTNRRSIRDQLKGAGLYGTKPERPDDAEMLGDEEVCDDDADTHPIRVSRSEQDEPVTRDAIAEAAARLHPAALVYMEPSQPVLVDDGQSWLLFFDQWWDGCRYSCDGEDMGPVEGRGHLEEILGAMAEVYGEMDEPAREAAARHVEQLRGLSGGEVYRWARSRGQGREDA